MNLRFLTLLAVLTLSACDMDGSITFPGTYTLTEVEEHSLPAHLHTLPGTPPKELYVTEGSIRLDEDGDYYVAFMLETQEGGTVTAEDRWSDSGAFIRVNRALSFSSRKHNGLKYAGVLHEDGILIDHDLSSLLGTDVSKRFDYEE